MPDDPACAGNTVAQPKTDDHPEALRPAVDSMTVLVAAVIVHDVAGNRVALLQRGDTAKGGSRVSLHGWR
jgi:hypothetical protein